MEGTAGESTAVAQSETAIGLCWRERTEELSSIASALCMGSAEGQRVGSRRLTPGPAMHPVADGTRVGRRARCPREVPGI